MKTLKIFLMVVFLFSSYSIFATVYYVKAGGNDDSSGKSVSAAWKTLYRVAVQQQPEPIVYTVFQPGDTIRLEGGTIFEPEQYKYVFQSALWITSSGSEIKPIVINSYPTENGKCATIKVSVHGCRGIFASKKEYLIIKNINIEGGYNPFNLSNHGIIGGYGIWMIRTSDFTKRMKSIYIDSCNVENFEKSGIAFGASIQSSIYKTGFEDIKVSNCNVDSIGYYGISISYAMDPNNSWYDNNNRPSRNVLIYGNTISNIAGVNDTSAVGKFSGVGIYCTDIDTGLIERNLVKNCGQLNTSNGGGNGGIDGVQNQHFIIQYNEVYNQKSGKYDGNGIHLDRGNEDCIMQYNYSHENKGVGLGFYTYSGYDERRTTFRTSGDSIIEENIYLSEYPYGDKNNTIRYNISQNNGYNGDIFSGEISIINGAGTFRTMTNYSVYNNTLYSKTDSANQSNSCLILKGKLYTSVFNNIFMTGDTLSKLIDIISFTGEIVNLNIQSNIYWGKENNFKVQDGNVSNYYRDYKTWQFDKFREIANTLNQPYILFNLNHDPELVNPGGAGKVNPFYLDTMNSYRRNINSIATNKGIDQSSYFQQISKDFFNNDLPINNFYDIGAYESTTQSNKLFLQIYAFIQGFIPLQVRDTITAYLANSTSPYTKIDTSKYFMTSYGRGNFNFDHTNDGSYYIVLEHRNSIETWSSIIEFYKGRTTSYDFSYNYFNVLGDNGIMVNNKFCIFGGDVNQDGSIDGEDISSVDNAIAIGLTGYVKEDLTGDDFVDGEDLTICENNNSVTVISP